LLNLKKYKGIKIMKAGDFLSLFLKK